MTNPGKLTAVAVSNKTKRGRYADGGGLYLQVSEWGTKSWIFRYMIAGKPRTMGLGDIHTFTLKEARERARAARQLVADGLDPLLEKQKQKDAARIEAARVITFEAAAERYIQSHAPGWRNAKHGDQWRATLSTYAFPVCGGLPVSAIDTALVLKILEPIWTTKSETASRVRGRVEAILDWAAAKGFRPRGENPARWKGHIDQLLPPKTKVAKVRHQPAMPYVDVPAFMAEMATRNSASARALMFTILCGTRTSETIEATWDEINLTERVWSIPGERMKSGIEHRVPISVQAVEILKTLPREHGGFVFPGRPGKPLSNMAMLEMLRGMRDGLTVHGFRSTFRDWAAEQTNFPREICEAALGHVVGSKTERSYQRGDLLEKRRELMEAWAAFCGGAK